MSYLLHQLLTSSAQRDPEHIALVAGDRTLTYGELDEQSNQVARLLSSLGVQPRDRVGLYLDKSAEAVIGLYGILKAGGAYVPLDPAAPPGRTGYIAADCGLRWLVTSERKAETWPELIGAGAPIEHLIASDAGDDEVAPAGVELHRAAALADQSAEDVGINVIDNDLALILYTSGSTGNPKGVMLSHRNVLAFVDWAVREFNVTSEDRLSQLAPLHFDLSTFDLYGAALAGASVHLVTRQTIMFPIKVRAFVEEHEISVMYSVPSILTLLVERAKLEIGDLPSLRTILFAGEVFSTKYLSRIMKLVPHVEFANLYGPTETNVCTYYRVPGPPPEDDPPISIGKAIDNVETFAVADDGSLASPGETGELYVRGATVMQGYWGDPERSAQTRIENPFGGEVRDHVYRTGDLVVEEGDGNYTFLGRRDSQIKSRGYRIELGDIEAAILAHPNVIECAVVPVPDELVTNRLTTFVVGDLSEQDLVGFVGERLPSYMIPEVVVFEDTLPKTSTGKIDRQRLASAAVTEGTSA